MGDKIYFVLAMIFNYWRVAVTLAALAVGFFLIGMP